MLAFLLLGALGCDSGPVAPALSDSRVYRNSTEGFRFLVPEGWIQTASSTLPPGKLRLEVFLVRYNMSTPEMGANFQVICMDDDPSLDLETHHAGPSFRVAKWNVSQGRQTVTVGGKAGEQMQYTADVNNRGLTKMVTSFRQNGRVYSFIGVFWSNDEKAKQEVEHATNDIIWTD